VRHRRGGLRPRKRPDRHRAVPEASAIATDPQGDSLITWTVDPEGAEPVLARWLSASGQLGATLELFPGGHGFEPQVGMAPSGRAFVAWRSATNTESTVYGRWVEPDGSLGPLLTLASPDPGKFSAVEDHVAVDPAGVATVSLRNDAGANPFIVIRRIAPDSSVGRCRRKSDAGAGSGSPTCRTAPRSSFGVAPVPN
jgi:hypothetical protein